MSNYNFNYSFNISGNCQAAVNEIAEGVGRLNTSIASANSMWDSFEGKMLALNQFSQYMQNLTQGVQDMMRPGADLNAQIADLSAIAGVAGKELETITENARATAIAFGGSAAQSVESYKLLLSQLSPELAKQPAALRAMGDNIAILSKTMGGDATAAATVLTTAMNQYGVSLADPMEASRKMAEMMNIMAAAGREGSAELPTIQKALEQCGMMAKSSGVSFAETNAAIQALDKAGKKGAEGGVALRNVMSILSQGRFLPKDVREELAAAGIDINDLTDKSKSLTERMRALQPVMNDSALFTKLFGRENSAAAMALMQSLDQVDAWTVAITGTNTAVDQSKIVMETYNERLARVQARFDDFKISIFNATGNLGIWTQVIGQALIPVAQLAPLIMGVGKAMIWLKSVNFASAFTTATSAIKRNILALVGLNGGLTVTGGFVQMFKSLTVSACRQISVAIMNIPIVGWIAAIIAAVLAVIQLIVKGIQALWDKCKGFRVFVFTVWELIKSIFSQIGDAIMGVVRKIGSFFSNVFNKVKEVFVKIRDWISGIVQSIVAKISTICEPLVKAFRKAVDAIGGFFSNIINWVRDKFNAVIDWFIGIYNKIAKAIGWDEIKARGQAAADVSWAKDHPENDSPNTTPAGGVPDAPDATPNPIASNIGGIGGGAESSDRIKNINITIDSLVGSLTIETTNMQESKERIKDIVVEALLGAVNDVNLAM